MKANLKMIGLWGTLSLLIFALSNSSCMIKKTKYYQNQRNYITVTGEIYFINDNETKRILYLAFDNMSEKLDDNCFKIVGENYEIVKSSGQITIGKSVEFITAPHYFGDGYVMPIVGLIVDGETILDFDTGYANLMKYLK